MEKLTKATFQFASSDHSGTVLTGLNHLREQQLLFDATLVVGDHHFPVHKAVLAACSEYFRALFTGEMRERQQEAIKLNGVSALGLRHLLDYAYTSRLTLDLKNVLAVLSAASHLQILPVIGACAEFLYSEIDMENCVDILTISETFSLAGLRKYGYTFIGMNLDKLTYYQEFNRCLTVAQLEYLLSGKFMVSCSEAEVLQVTNTWILFDLCNRWKHFKRLFRCINLAEVLIADMESIIGTDDVCRVGSRWYWEKLQYLREHAVGHLCETKAGMAGIVNVRAMQRAVVNVGGFTKSTGPSTSLTYLVDGSRVWRNLTDIPYMEQSDFGVTVLNNELYIIGGILYEQNQDSVHGYGIKYNPCTRKWTCLAMMNSVRCSFYLGTFESKIYAIGDKQTGACESYDPDADTWTDLAHLPNELDRYAGAVGKYSGVIYIAGGTDGIGDDPDDTVWEYDIRNDSWSSGNRMLTPRADHDMVCHRGKLYIAGGWSKTQNGQRLLSHSLDMFDEDSHQWQVLTQLPNPRYFASLTCVQEKLYFIGGRRLVSYDQGSSEVDAYDLNSRQWSMSKYPVEIWEHQSCELLIPPSREDTAFEVLS